MGRVEFILVHGKFHGPWCWDPVRERLESVGSVAAPTLPLESLAGDASVVRDQVMAARRRGRRVVLVGHSYAGMVISSAGHEADQLVYVAALTPLPGRTNREESNDASTPVREEAITVSGTTVALDGPGVRDAFYHLSSDRQFAQVKALLRPCSIDVQDEPVHRPAWQSTPSAYVVCTEDRAVAPTYQYQRASRLQRWCAIRADHSPFYSLPDELERALMDFAEPGSAEADRRARPVRRMH